jgi:branched-chain amino acid transport system ATP-binding protein
VSLTSGNDITQWPIVLETMGLEKRFGGIVASNFISLKIDKGIRHALIGPNGVGKTTLINLLTRTLQPTNTKILFDKNEITDLKPV